jgi:hypothetical protein
MKNIKSKLFLAFSSFVALLVAIPEPVFARTIAQYEYVQVQTQDGNTTSALIDYTHKKVCVVMYKNNELKANVYNLNGNSQSFTAGSRKYKTTGNKLDVPASHHEAIDTSKKCGDPSKCVLNTSITAYYDYRFQKKARILLKGNTIKFWGMENNSSDSKASHLEYQSQTLFGKGKPSCKV